MPIMGGGGGGGGPAAGTYLPVADSAGVTVDTTTYDNPVTGLGKLTTLVFPADTAVFAFARQGDAFPQLIMQSSAGQLHLGDGAIDPYNAGMALGGPGITAPAFVAGSASQVRIDVEPLMTAVRPENAPRVDQVSPLFTIEDGALPTVQLVSGTGAQILTTRDTETVTPCTFNPGAATTATVTVALSPDNVTYSTLAVVTEPAGVALDGTILPVKVRVPAGWYLKLTANAQAVLGLTTYY